ncbi:MAG: lipopolysaccharide biosynthesis protein RfbH [Pseudomonadota bacterium]
MPSTPTTAPPAIDACWIAADAGGRPVVICQVLGDHALVFDHAADAEPDAAQAETGVRRLRAVPVADLRPQAALSWPAAERVLRALAVRHAVEHATRTAAQPVHFVPGQSRIQPSGKVVGAPEAANLVEASLDLWLTAGRFSDRFEAQIAAWFGASKAIAVNSGSSANLVALSTLTSPQLGDRALRKGDEVITAAAGFPTTVNPILQNGLVPVFVDSELGSGNIDVRLIEAAIGPRTRAIMAAHTLGNPMDMREIMRIARKHNLWVIEDCCDAFGSTLDGRKCGTFGDLATLSFYPAHHITMGEGGAVFGRDANLMKLAESFRDWGRDCYCPPGKENTCGQRFCWKLGQLPQGYDHKYIYTHAGYNLKITDMQAAVGVAQLERLPGFIERRIANHARLLELLREAGADQYLELPQVAQGAVPSWFGFLATLKEGAPCSRNELTSYLEEQGIGTRLLFAGNLTKQPYFAGREWRAPGPLHNADILMERAFWIGVWPGLSEAHLRHMAGRITGFLGLTWD